MLRDQSLDVAMAGSATASSSADLSDTSNGSSVMNGYGLFDFLF